MPVHEFRCRDCDADQHLTFSVHDHIPESFRCSCGGELRRVWEAPDFHRFHEHFNKTLNRDVSSMSDFRTGLYEAQEKMTERLGFQQKYRVVDGDEKRKQSNSEVGMKETHDKRIQLGMST